MIALWRMLIAGLAVVMGVSDVHAAESWSYRRSDHSVALTDAGSRVEVFAFPRSRGGDVGMLVRERRGSFACAWDVLDVPAAGPSVGLYFALHDKGSLLEYVEALTFEPDGSKLGGCAMRITPEGDIFRVTFWPAGCRERDPAMGYTVLFTADEIEWFAAALERAKWRFSGSTRRPPPVPRLK